MSKKPHDEILGNDSFLDVVANVVGILIILLMAVAAQAKDSILEQETAVPTIETVGEDENSESIVSRNDVEHAKSAEQQVEADIHRINGELAQQDLEVRYRQAERDRAQLLVTAAEQSIGEMRSKLDQSQQEEFDRRNQLAASMAELDQIRERIDFLDSSQPTTAILEHLPTPMAKTVFGKELHLRMRGGRIAVIPWDEFIQMLKDDAGKNVWRLQDQDEFTQLVGPVGGFWMHYTLKRQVQTMSTKVGIATQQTVVLDKFTLTPESEGMGETIDAAFQENSQLLTMLASHRPASTTITVWTYPDSFNQFRKLKHELYKRGYVTAARPLPDDHPIGGSPSGTRSAAQ